MKKKSNYATNKTSQAFSNDRKIKATSYAEDKNIKDKQICMQIN